MGWDSFLGHPDSRSEDLGHRELATAKLLNRLPPASRSARAGHRVEVGEGNLETRSETRLTKCRTHCVSIDPLAPQVVKSESLWGATRAVHAADSLSLGVPEQTEDV